MLESKTINKIKETRALLSELEADLKCEYGKNWKRIEKNADKFKDVNTHIYNCIKEEIRKSQSQTRLFK